MKLFTSEDLMKAMSLQVGDRIKIGEYIYVIDEKYILIHEEGLASNYSYMSIRGLIDLEVEILPRPKRVGDTLCKDCECVECHLRCLPYCNHSDRAKETLFNILDGWNEYYTFDQEIHDLLKARLDKEVNE